jgi:S1-C subfamily serine protease
VNRNGRDREITARLGEAETDDGPRLAEREDRTGIEDALGFAYRDLDRSAAERLGLDPDVEGALITDVDQGSAAFREANLRAGSVIVEADGEPVRDAEDLERIYDDVEPGGSFLLRVLQPNGDGGSTMITALVKPE